jgi:molybdopterin-guanine dinucleotide biosynthesis protein A
VARSQLTGVLLVGGGSTRFGSPKALARIGGETLAERGWSVLAEACDERLAVGKRSDGLDLPFDLVDDGTDTRAALTGIVAGLRAAAAEVTVVTPALLLELAAACTDAAAPRASPLPAAFHKRALPVLERRLDEGRLALHDALAELRAVRLEVDAALLANVNTPDDLRRLG